MTKHFIFYVLALTFFLMMSTCSSIDAEYNDDSRGSSDSDGDSDSDSDGDSDGDIDEIIEDIGEDGICGDFSGGADPIPTRVMLLLDASTSMGDDNKWTIAVNAINAMVDTYGDLIAFGLDAFPAGGGFGGGGGGGGDASCGVRDSVLHDAVFETVDGIRGDLQQLGPNGATPLLLALRNFTSRDYAPVFTDGTADSYIVIVSDGQDTCGSAGVFDMNGSTGASPNELGNLVDDFTTVGIRTYAIGFGSGATQGEGVDQLNAIAQNGGTGESTFLDATDPSELERVLDNLAQSVAVNCQYRLGQPEPGADLDNVNVYLDGNAIGRADDCDDDDGWTWADDNRERIMLCGDPCDDLQDGEIDEVRVIIMCDPADVVI